MHLLKIVEGQLRVGEPLPWSIRDANGQLLLAAGQVLGKASQIEALLERGATVEIEELRSATDLAELAEAALQRPPSLFGQWERLLWVLDKLLRSLAVPDFPTRCAQLAGQLIGLVQRDADIAIYLGVRQDPKRLTIYPLAHSLHCASLGWLVGARLGWPEARTLALVKAALTMNVSTLELQGRLAAQDVPASAAQLAEIRRHPARSVELLREAGVDEADWLDAVAQHHEKSDGSGYPAGVREVGELATVLRFIDVYLAKMAPRAMRPPLTAQQAARDLFKESGGSPLAAAIIKEYGIYPPGEFVRLKTGEMAVVTRRGAHAATPLAAAITDRQGQPVIHTTVRDTAQPAHAIDGLALDRKLVLRVPPERLFGLPE